MLEKVRASTVVRSRQRKRCSRQDSHFRESNRALDRSTARDDLKRYSHNFMRGRRKALMSGGLL